MATLTTLEKARIHDEATNTPLSSGSFSATSSDPLVASIQTDATIFIVGQTAGTATVTVTRNADGETAELEVEVTSGSGFSVTLGPVMPK